PSSAASDVYKRQAERLAKEGMDLILIARRRSILIEISEKIAKKYNVEVIPVAKDLTLELDLEDLVNQTRDLEVGILVNNAGFGKFGEFENLNLQDGLDMIRLNCLAPYYLTQVFVPQMIKRGKGAVMILGSVVGCQPTPYYTTYAATKAFDNMFGAALWNELESKNIDVLSVLPGGTITGFQKIANTKQQSFYRTAEQVVESSMKALGKKPVVVDGFLNKIMTSFSKILSYKLSASVAGKIVKKAER
ncbi:MAG: SDR family NAD(P)-dependent oxidoreductase, partial [Ignavibacteriaceae bacterium]|nr:SDR family NAD(P)-dependent oxidoreductase [Ignavibacteriaceae bacterium]